MALGLLLLTLMFFDAIINLQAERLWFIEVNYLEVFWLRMRSHFPPLAHWAAALNRA